jgi:preprotein translocase subunit SecF
MEFIKAGTTIDFLRYVKSAYIFSTALILIGVVAFWYRGGLNYGVDFAGGTIVHVKFSQPTDAASIRAVVSQTDIADITVQDFGQAGDEFLIRLPKSETGVENFSNRIRLSLADGFGEEAYDVRRVESVGPKVGKDLRRKGILAVVFATAMMGTYLAFRFELRFGLGAAIALIHDVLITTTALLVADVEFDLTVVAALLTVIGYSVNDTVIVCDRVRENMRKLRRETLHVIINRSINETLSRTVITTGTVLMVILALFFLGGSVLHAFALVLLVGMTVGTYSSIYVASPIVLLWEKEKPRR